MQAESNLDASGRTLRDHAQLHLGTLLQSIQATRKGLAEPKPPRPNAQLPRGTRNRR
jgi:hypothetical protein